MVVAVEPQTKKGYTLWGFLILSILPLLVGALGCGKKGPPVAPESTTPAAIHDLRAVVAKGMVLLSWTIPGENTDDSKLADLSGFKVFRGETTFDTPECPNCPERFRELADIDYRRTLPDNVSVANNTVEFADGEVSDRTIYTYKVLSYNSYGVFSEGSNTVRISWDVPQSGGK